MNDRKHPSYEWENTEDVSTNDEVIIGNIATESSVTSSLSQCSSFTSIRSLTEQMISAKNRQRK